MKKTLYLLSMLILLVANSVYASDYKPGPYVGGQVGWGRINEGMGYKEYAVKNGLTATDLGTFVGWRAYGGYSLLPFFGIEGGYSYYPDNTYTYNNGNNFNIKSYTIDLVAKIIIPFAEFTNKPLSHFSIYGKGGGAYVNTKINSLSNVKKTNSTIRPAFGAGIIYNFTDNIAVDASWTSVLGRNRVIQDEVTIGNDNPTPHCNLFTLGLSYKITGIF